MPTPLLHLSCISLTGALACSKLSCSETVSVLLPFLLLLWSQVPSAGGRALWSNAEHPVDFLVELTFSVKSNTYIYHIIFKNKLCRLGYQKSSSNYTTIPASLGHSEPSYTIFRTLNFNRFKAWSEQSKCIGFLTASNEQGKRVSLPKP